MTVHIMLDLETWGKTPGCDLRSIGAVVFDPLTGNISNYQDGWPGIGSQFYVATDNPLQGSYSRDHFTPVQLDMITYGRKYAVTRDPETVKWWNDQSAEAQAAFANPIDLREALEQFTMWLESLCWTPHLDFAGEQMAQGEWREPLHNFDVLCLWSHGPAFDVSILDAAYRAVGLPTPWHYRAPRDTRTAFDMADVGDHSAFMQRFNHGTAHNALDDAISQAGAVCEAYRIVREWRTTHDAVFTDKGCGGA